jgi:hypothetical protein
MSGKKNLNLFWAFTTMLCVQCYYLIGTFIYYIASVTNKEVPTGPAW